MPTHTPPESELRRLLASLHKVLSIHVDAQKSKANAQAKRTDDILIAEVRVSIAWVEYLLQEHGECRDEYRRLLPKS